MKAAEFIDRCDWSYETKELLTKGCVRNFERVFCFKILDFNLRVTGYYLSYLSIMNELKPISRIRVLPSPARWLKYL